MAAHLLPLGAKDWQLNSASGVMGMAIFFTLSGFLIATFLLNNPNVANFLIRRFFRIIPLAWLCMAVVMLSTGGDLRFWLANFLFYANWPPMSLGDMNGHLWSLCVEIQFYVGIALAVILLRKYWLWVIPIACLAITSYRMLHGVHVAINTYYRIDEILAGSMLAIIYKAGSGKGWATGNGWAAEAVLLILFVISCHPAGGFFNYFRPYFGTGLVGLTLFNHGAGVGKIINNRLLIYLAAISYALYVIHPLLTYTWLGSGEGLVKYMKRPLLFAALFAIAHMSTFYFEHRCISFGKSLARSSKAA